MTTTTPEALLRPDARMVRVLAGETGFAPPAFLGQAGFATDGATTVLALRSEHTVVVVSSTVAVSRARLADALGLPPEVVVVSTPSGAQEASSEVENIARAAIGGLREARVEWTAGLVPTGGWATTSGFWVARVATADGGELVGTLVLTPIGCSTSSAVEIITSATGTPAVVIAAAEGAEETDMAQGRALGHAAIAAIDVLPSAGSELYLDRVVESGAPLAVWRPRVVRDRTETALVVGDGTWHVGPAVIRFDGEGRPLSVTLPTGPYAG